MTDYSKLDNPTLLSYIFHPVQTGRSEAPEGAVDLDIEVDSEVSIGCRFFGIDKNGPTIIYFHGNGEVAGDYDMIGPMYNQVGINILVTDYRGYGWSGGMPTVKNMLADAKLLFNQGADWLKENGWSGPIFIMGRSLGSACAIELMSSEHDDMKGLILESGFCDTLPLLRTIGVDPTGLDLQEEDCFNNREKIGQVKKPTFILHGSHDDLIPLAEAEKLQAYSGARSKEFHVIPGAAHNTMIAVGGMVYFETIKQFMDKVTGASSWRKRRQEYKGKPRQ